MKPGANYGWPLVTYGIAYNGDKVGVGQERAGIEKPVYYWVPSIGTSGLTFYTGRSLSQVARPTCSPGGLYGMVERLQLDGDKVVHKERLLEQLNQRIRDVRTGPDGLLYVLTDSPKGELMAIAPR